MQKKKKKTVAVYIGKFQPQHIAHEENMTHCVTNYDHTIVLVGSVNKRMSILTPFSYNTIQSWVKSVDESIIVKPIKDYIYNETKWIAQVEEAVYAEFLGEDVEFTLVGHKKDATSFYLKEFPNFRYESRPSLFDGLSATDIRNRYFSKDGQMQEGLVSDLVAEHMVEFRGTEEFDALKEEWEFYEKEDSIFENYPFPETLKFNCSDAVLVCDGNILLVKRALAPGKGIWALPGGFVNRNETYEECAIRELIEETSVAVPKRALKSSIKRSKIFDDPRRTVGVPRISNAFHIEIQPSMKTGYSKLPKVKGEDDVAEAQWFPLAIVKRMQLFDDHSDIIDYFVNSF